MSKHRAETTQSLGVTPVSHPEERPAVCLATAEAEPLPAAILRAYRHGHDVFVVPLAEDGEIVEFANRLNASVIDPDDGASSTSRTDHLVKVAKENGFVGLIYHELPSDPVDYELTNLRFDKASDYCISPILAPESGSKSIVAGIPAYNEETSIASVVLGAAQCVDEIVVVDDGSTDRTADIAEEAGAIVLRHDENRGKGAALQTLLDYAETIDFESLVLLDGDGQHLPEDIPAVAEPVINNEADLVIGSRYADQSPDDETPEYRRVGQQVLDFLLLGTSRTRLSDSQSGFRALSPQAVEELSIDSTNYAVESEMIDSIVQQDLEIVEKPIEVRYDGVDGQTRHPLYHGFEVATFLIHMIQNRHPLLFFAIPGLVVTVAGMAYGIDGILVYRATEVFYPVKAFISGFLTIIGVLGLFTGLILNRMSELI